VPERGTKYDKEFQMKMVGKNVRGGAPGTRNIDIIKPQCSLPNLEQLDTVADFPVF